MRDLSQRELSDMETLIRFVGIFCRKNHGGDKTLFTFSLFDTKMVPYKRPALCPGCMRLLRYGLAMRLRCPHDPKPMCKKCGAQCFNSTYKQKIREIMKFSGLYLIKHGRLDMIYHYFR